MINNFSHSDSGLARILYQGHGYISEPLYRTMEYMVRMFNPLTPNIFNHRESVLAELAHRAFIPVAAGIGAFSFYNHLSLTNVRTFALGFAGYEITRLALHTLAYSMQEKEYIHVRGTAKEQSTTSPKIATFNIFGFPAGMNYIFGGCSPLRDRFSEIIKLIRKADADVLVLQEFFVDAKTYEDFIGELQNDFAHLFIHNGPSKLGLESGLMVLSKLAVSDYSFTEFTHRDSVFKRGFTTLTVKNNPADIQGSLAIIGAHLDSTPSEAGHQMRAKQLRQIHKAAKKINDVQLVVLAADTNINMKDLQAVEHTGITTILHSLYSTGAATCTNRLRKLKSPDASLDDEEWVDQIAIISGAGKRSTEIKIEKHEIFEAHTNCSKTAISDHHLLLARVNLL